jgi:hypothetical protein
MRERSLLALARGMWSVARIPGLHWRFASELASLWVQSHFNANIAQSGDGIGVSVFESALNLINALNRASYPTLKM